MHTHKVSILGTGHSVHAMAGHLGMEGVPIACLQPQLIFSCATLQTWWLRETLSPEAAGRLSQVDSGPWLSTHLALSRKLMLAVRASNWLSHVINSDIPDISNAVLGMLFGSVSIDGEGTNREVEFQRWARPLFAG